MWVGGQRHSSADLLPGKDTRYPLYRSCVGPRAGLYGCGNLALTGIRSPDLQSVVQSLYRPSQLTRPPREGYTVDNFKNRTLREGFGNNGRNLFVPKFGPQWKQEKYVTVQTEIVFVIIMHLFNYICGNKLLVPTIRHIIVIHILYMFSFSPSYFFRLAAILRQFTNKWLKIHSNKSVLTMLNM